CIFEIKESTILHDQVIQERLQELGQKSAGIALENFGARQPDFSYLQKLKFRYIKVASHYIHNITDNRENQFYIKTLVQMIHGLDTLVLAEMVESEMTEKMIQKLGMDGAQGYFYGKPTSLL
ncbi:MAG: EAL domain-containing protein, partial [Gammaproteobacteria bacterium]|nr:EAL domain-containing protein [Gammaproteobacteria bacterium]